MTTRQHSDLARDPHRAGSESPPPRPTALVPILEHIPVELRKRPQWVAWRYEWVKKRWTKVPYSPVGGKAGKGGNARSNDPRTWVSFEQAVAYCRAAHFDGIGYMLTTADGLVGIDLDHCTDDQGQLMAWALAIVDRFPNTYWEISPSGEGRRGFVRGMIPSNVKTPTAELYSTVRFLTITGHRTGGAPDTIADHAAAILQLHGELKPPREPRARTAPSALPTNRLTDEQVIRMAKGDKDGPRFTRLFIDGDWSGFPSASEADWRLVTHLAFYCGPDPERIDRLYRQSALSHHPDRTKEWDDPRGDTTYGGLTIAEALKDRPETDYWSPQEWSLADIIGGERATPEDEGEPPPEDEEGFPSFGGDLLAENRYLRERVRRAEQRADVREQQLAELGERFRIIRELLFSSDLGGKRAAVAVATTEIIQEQRTKGAQPGDEWEIPNAWIAKRAGCSKDQAGDYLQEFARAGILQREPIKRLGVVEEMDRTTGEIRPVHKKIWHSIFTVPDATPLELLHTFAGHHAEPAARHGGSPNRCTDHPNANIKVKTTRSCEVCGKYLGTVDRTLHRHPDDYVQTFPHPHFDLTLAEEANGDSRLYRQLAARENTSEGPPHRGRGGGNLPVERDAEPSAGIMPAEPKPLSIVTTLPLLPPDFPSAVGPLSDSSPLLASPPGELRSGNGHVRSPAPPVVPLQARPVPPHMPAYGGPDSDFPTGAAPRVPDEPGGLL